MSSFVHFASSLSRFKTESVEDIAPESTVALRTNVAGYYLLKTFLIVKRVRPLAQAIYDRIPLIAGGPQPMLNVLYLKISAVSGDLQSSVSEQDKLLPDNLKCQHKLEEAWQYLGKFYEYVPQLISNSAPTLQNYIDSLRQLVDVVVKAMDYILAVIPQAEAMLAPSVASVPEQQKETAHYAAAIMTTIESLVIDFTFFLTNEQIAGSPQAEVITQWVGILRQGVRNVFGCALKERTELIAAVSPFSEQNLSILQLVDAMSGLVTSTSEYYSFAAHGISLHELIRNLEDKPMYNIIESIIPNLADCLINEKPVTQYLAQIKAVHQLALKITSRPSYMGYGKAAMIACGTLTDVMSFIDSENPLLQVIVILVVCRLFAMIGSDFETSEKILAMLSFEISKIIGVRYADIMDTAQGLFRMYDGNLLPFEEDDLGQLSYHVSALRELGEFDPNSNFYLSNIEKVFNSAGCLPKVIQLTSGSCHDARLKPQFEIYRERSLNNAHTLKMMIHQMILTICSIIQLRAECASTMFYYILEKSITLPEGVSDAVNAIHATFQTVPQHLVYDVAECCKILQHMGTIQAKGQDILNTICEQQDKDIYKLLYPCGRSMMHLAADFPSPVSQLPTISKSESRDDFVAAMIANTFQLIPTVAEVQRYFEKSPRVFAFFFSITMCGVNYVNYLVQLAPSFSGQLAQFVMTTRNTLDVVWPIAGSVACGGVQGEANNLKLYTDTLPKNLQDILRIAESMPQPKDEINMTPEMKELRKLEEMAATIPEECKKYADIWIKWIKDEDIGDARAPAKQWLKSCSSDNQDYVGSCEKMMDAAIQFLTKPEETDSLVNTLIETFCILSVSLAKNTDFKGAYDNFMTEHHLELFQCIKKLIVGEKHMTRLAMRIISVIVEIESLQQFKNLTPEDLPDTFRLTYYRMVRRLDRLKRHSRNTKVTLNCIREISTLITLLFVGAENQMHEPITEEKHLKPVMRGIMNRRVTESVVQESLDDIAQRLVQLVPTVYPELPKYNDVDELTDYVYDKVSAVRDAGNEILRQSNTKQSNNDELAEVVRNHAKAVVEAASLTRRTLEVQKSTKTPLFVKYIEACASAFSNLHPFASSTMKILSDGESRNFELRRLNRNIAKQLDYLINIIERPPQFEITVTGLTDKIDDVNEKISGLFETISISLVKGCIAAVPEMIVGEVGQLKKDTEKAIEVYNAAMNALRDAAVGPTANNLANVAIQIDTTLHEFVESLDKISFELYIPVDSILSAMKGVGDAILKWVKVFPTLTDHVEIEPDPIAAEKIAEFKLPGEPSDTELTPVDALQEVEEAKDVLNKELVSFQEMFADGTAASMELVEADEKLFKVAVRFGEQILKAAKVCQCPRTTASFLTVSRTYESAVAAIQNAVKSRLMRAANFEEELTDAIKGIKEPVDQLFTLAEESSKYEPPTEQEPEPVFEDDGADGGDDDEVSRELKAAAAALAAMTARIAEFSASVETEPEPEVEEDIPEDIPEDEEKAVDEPQEIIIDVKAEQGSLPGFVISHATPMLQTTGQIVKRAQEITAAFLAAGVKMNEKEEKTLVKCAQNLSESAELLIITAEILVKGEEQQAEYKVISAARIIKATVASLVSNVLQRGGDAEGIMNKHVRTVRWHADKVVRKCTKIVKSQLDEADKKKRKPANPTIARLNMQNEINNKERELQQAERSLKDFYRNADKAHK